MWKIVGLALCAAATLGQAQNAGPQVAKYDIEESLDDLWSFEHFALHQHQLTVGTTRPDGRDFHFDVLLGTVVKVKDGEKVQKKCPNVYPVYQHMDKKTKRRYLSVYENTGKPLAYCALAFGECGANLALYEYNGYNVKTLHGKNTRDTMYRTEADAELMPYQEKYEKNATQPVCYIWARSQHRNEQDENGGNGDLRNLFQHLVPLSVFYDAAKDDHIYDTKMREGAQHLGVIGQIIKFESGDLFKGACKLTPVTISYRKPPWSDWDIVVSDRWYKFRLQHPEYFEGIRQIGWAAENRDSCKPLQQLGIYEHRIPTSGHMDVNILPPDETSDIPWEGQHLYTW